MKSHLNSNAFGARGRSRRKSSSPSNDVFVTETSRSCGGGGGRTQRLFGDAQAVGIRTATKNTL
jgi:hypothetical protein